VIFNFVHFIHKTCAYTWQTVEYFDASIVRSVLKIIKQRICVKIIFVTCTVLCTADFHLFIVIYNVLVLDLSPRLT
jgi:hypothetical protein